MELFEVRTLAVELLNQYGLTGWRVEFDRAKTRAGQCRYRDRVISLSAPLMRLQGEAEVRETVLHEVAHALAGSSAGHGPAWQTIAMRIGASGNRMLSAKAVPRKDWVGTCPAGHEAHRHRRPSQPLSCGQCSRTFSPDALLHWTYRGNPALMSPSYREAERRMRAAYSAGRGVAAVG